MTVSPETLDAPLCEWCSKRTKATAKVGIYMHEPVSAYLCHQHSNEVWTEFHNVNIEPLTSPAPEYTILESGAEPMTGEWTIAELELAARYGAPYPVCGDLTAKKRNLPYFKALLNAQFAKESWTGHDPNGTQY